MTRRNFKEALQPGKTPSTTSFFMSTFFTQINCPSRRCGESPEGSTDNSTAAPGFSIPDGALTGSGNLDMIVVVNQQDLYAFVGPSNTTDLNQTGMLINGIDKSGSNGTDAANSTVAGAENTTAIVSSLSGVVSITFKHPKSSTQGTGEFKVANLSTPIQITIPHKPLSPGSFAQCRYWDEEAEEYATDGCVVNTTLSTSRFTVCECTHLTDFNIGEISFFSKILELANIGNIDFKELLPSFPSITLSDIKNLTFANIVNSPGPFIVVMVFLALFFLFLPITYEWDRKREAAFVNEFVFNIDESCMQEEIGTAFFKLEELVDNPENTKPLVYAGVNNRRGENCCARFRCQRYKTHVHLTKC